MFLCIFPVVSYSQIIEDTVQRNEDTAQPNAVLISQNEETIQPNEDSISQNKDSVKTVSKKKTFESRVNYSAKDSISIDMTDKRIYMYKNRRIRWTKLDFEAVIFSLIFKKRFHIPKAIKISVYSIKEPIKTNIKYFSS